MSPQVISLLFSIVVLSFATSVMVQKRKQEPNLKLFGIPVSGIITINLFAIMLFVVLLVYTLMGNPMAAAVKPPK